MVSARAASIASTPVSGTALIEPFDWATRIPPAPHHEYLVDEGFASMAFPHCDDCSADGMSAPRDAHVTPVPDAPLMEQGNTDNETATPPARSARAHHPNAADLSPMSPHPFAALRTRCL